MGPFVFGPSGAVTYCTDPRTLDFRCHQERYYELVRHSGVQAAFDELQEAREENGFVRAACHQLTHVIGRTGVELYGDLPGAYAHGEPARSSGYYHGVTEAIMARVGTDEVLEEADEICAGPRERWRHSIPSPCL